MAVQYLGKCYVVESVEVRIYYNGRQCRRAGVAPPPTPTMATRDQCQRGIGESHNCKMVKKLGCEYRAGIDGIQEHFDEI